MLFLFIFFMFSVGLFGFSVVAVGMLCFVGWIISKDSYGRIEDNVRGLVVMAVLCELALDFFVALDSA